MLHLIGNINVQSTEPFNDFLYQTSWILPEIFFLDQVGLQTQSLPPELVKAAFGRSVEVCPIFKIFTYLR